jgi:hypothetical protein
MVLRRLGPKKWRLYSKATHVVHGQKKRRILGTFPSKKKAIKRERQINYFKRLR